MSVVEQYNEGRRDFRWETLRRAYLYNANLSGANLRAVDMRGANLSGANLSGADLQEANLSGANLSWANLIGANLSGAYLSGAKLRGAKLRGAKLPDFQIPAGAIEGWKKLEYDLIAELTIPWEARRTISLVGRKCRAEYAYVVAVYDGNLRISEGYSLFDKTAKYVPGTIVRPDKYDDDIRVECSSGIHFFLTRQEAENY